jgi:phosphoribosylaminoimidazolecarboxamide formyltransferase/IMP cyclohydrolase
MPRALLSVSDKIGLADLGRGLVARGFTLVSTGGTARTLSEAGLAVTSVSELTGFPEMMDGRIKTLHPAVHGGILARRDRADDLAALERHGLGLVDVVVVNLYPFVLAASDLATPFDALIEEIDIGGPSLVRAAAKNFRGVLVVIDPADYPRLLTALDATPTLAFRYELARKAFAHTAAYDAAIIRTLEDFHLAGERFERRSPGDGLQEVIDVSLRKIRDLRYGENPHQRAAWYVATIAASAMTSAAASPATPGSSGTFGFGETTLLQGKELSFTNLLDLDAAMRLVLEFEGPAAAVVKHTNPCGVAIAETIAEAYVQARDADSLSAFGGIVALNRAIDVATAQAIVTTKIDGVIAPAVDAAARAILNRKGNMRVVVGPFGESKRGAGPLGPAVGNSAALELRSIDGAVLVQERDRAAEARGVWMAHALPPGFRIVSRRAPTSGEWDALRFAWRVCAHVKSNSVVFSSRQRTLAIGAGQMSRVDAVNAAIAMTRGSTQVLNGSVAATDGFFPFRDGLDAVASAGASAVIHPGGSVRDEEVIAAADEHGLAMVFTGTRHFRH